MQSTPNYVFLSTTSDSIICAKSQPILLEFENFQKFRRIKEGGKLLEQLGNSRKVSVVNHKWPKLSFLIKRQRFGDAWKVSNDVHSIW